MVEEVVGTDGTLSHPRLIEAPPVATMTLAVSDLLRDTRFTPARRGDEPVASLNRVTMRFTLRR